MQKALSMNFKVIATVGFEKQLKRLSKKYPCLREDYAALVISLKQLPTQGKPLGGSCYKVRLAIASKGRGKSAGDRIITFISFSDKVLFLVVRG